MSEKHSLGDVTEDFDSDDDFEDGLADSIDHNGDAHVRVVDRNSNGEQSSDKTSVVEKHASSDEREISRDVKEVHDGTDSATGEISSSVDIVDQHDKVEEKDAEVDESDKDEEKDADVDESESHSHEEQDKFVERTEKLVKKTVSVTDSGSDDQQEPDRNDEIERLREETRPFHRFKDVQEDDRPSDHEGTEEVFPKETKVQPVPLPRRSTRTKRLPERFKDYQMYQMTSRPYDRKLQAVESLFKSGVFNEIDNETAHGIIASILSS